MHVRDPKKLARLMILQDVSQRELAAAAGWKTHSYLGRLLRGEAKAISPGPAQRIADYLEVGVEDLFTEPVTIPAGDQPERNSGRALGPEVQKAPEAIPDGSAGRTGRLAGDAAGMPAAHR